jgi:hypothetical protein
MPFDFATQLLSNPVVCRADIYIRHFSYYYHDSHQYTTSFVWRLIAIPAFEPWFQIIPFVPAGFNLST